MVLVHCQLSESSAPWAAPWNLLSLLPGWPLGTQSKSLPVGLPSGRPSLLLGVWGASHKSSLSLTLLLNQGKSGQGRKQLEPGDVLKDGHPSLVQSLCLPDT